MWTLTKKLAGGKQFRDSTKLYKNEIYKKGEGLSY